MNVKVDTSGYENGTFDFEIDVVGQDFGGTIAQADVDHEASLAGAAVGHFDAHHRVLIVGRVGHAGHISRLCKAPRSAQYFFNQKN